MKHEIEIGGKKITLSHESFGDDINVDDLTKIDTSHIYGEFVTISAAVNRIGLMKSEVESRMAEAKLEEKIFESNFKRNVRKEAAENNGKYKMTVDGVSVEVKVTEAFLKDCFESDEKWIDIKKKYIQSERTFNFLDSVYWASQDKSKKLNGLVSGTTPEDFVGSLVSGKINGILIKK